MVTYVFEGDMKRVLVVGAGLQGLACAVRKHLAKNQVVILEKRERIVCLGSSLDIHGFQLEHGPHLLLKGGPLHKMVKKVSKVKPSLWAIRPQKIMIVGHGPLYPVNSPKDLLSLKMGQDPIRDDAMKLISGWGQDIPERRKALLKGKLCVVGEGWSGLVGRLASSLEEVGVPIQPSCEVAEVRDDGVTLANGTRIPADEVIMATGKAKGKPVKVSTLDIVLDNKPLDGLHGIIKGDVAVIDLAAIHPMKSQGKSHLSCIALEGGIEAIESLLDERVSGWRSHILVKRANKSITLTDSEGGLADARM